MCGIYGMVLPEGKTFDAFTAMHLLRLASLSQTRGRDAFGYMVCSGKGGHVVQRFTGSVTDFLSRPKRIRSAMKVIMGNRIFLGHTRQTTVGDERRNVNNHPFVARHYIMAHNGHITNHGVVREKLGIASKEPDTDSYVMLALMERVMSKEPGLATPEVIAAAGDCLAGTGAFWLWDKAEKGLYLFRDVNPIYKVKVGDAFVFASEREIIEQAFRGLSAVPTELENKIIWQVNLDAIAEGKTIPDILVKHIPFELHSGWQGNVGVRQRDGGWGRGYNNRNRADYTGPEYGDWDALRHGVAVQGYGGGPGGAAPANRIPETNPYWLSEVMARDEGRTFTVFHYVTQCLGIEVTVNDPDETITIHHPKEIPAAANLVLTQAGLTDGRKAKTLEEFDEMAKEVFDIWRKNNHA